MKFDIDKYKGRYVMLCETEEEAKDFCNFLHSIGRTWLTGKPYSEEKNYLFYQKTVYYFNDGQHGSLYYAKKEGYTVLKWRDYMNKKFTKEDLKTGDVIKRSNGRIGIINGELEMIITESGWDDLDNIAKDLTNKYDSNYDIVAVRRPYDKCDCVFDAFEYNFGELIYDRDRDETVEMSLEEVCAALGKNIKIVKKK
jgi:hypothetical protein